MITQLMKEPNMHMFTFIYEAAVIIIAGFILLRLA